MLKFSERKLAEHIEIRCNSKFFRELMASDSDFHGDVKTFTAHHAKQKPKVTVYADFE